MALCPARSKCSEYLAFVDVIKYLMFSDSVQFLVLLIDASPASSLPLPPLSPRDEDLACPLPPGRSLGFPSPWDPRGLQHTAA